jgi:hypothetical protein
MVAGTSAEIDLNHFAPGGLRSMYTTSCCELREIEIQDLACRRHTSQEEAMAKAKKRVATRKKSSKRGKVSAKPARRKAAKRTMPKQARSKVRGAAKPMSNKQRQSKIAARKAPRQTPRQVVEVPVEDTIIDVIEEPVPGVVVVTEYETIRMAAPISSSPEPKRGVGPETEEQ